MGLFCFWLKCRTSSSRWRRKAEDEEREKKEICTWTPCTVEIILYKESKDSKLGVAFDNVPEVAIISQLSATSPAVGKLFVGERIMSVQGQDVQGPLHAARLLRESEGFLKIKKQGQDVEGPLHAARLRARLLRESEGFLKIKKLPNPNWQRLIRRVRQRHRVAISWRGLADAWLEHEERKYIPVDAPDEWWDNSYFPAKKHKALCKLRHPALTHRNPPLGYGALFSTERGGSDCSRSSRGTPINPRAITFNPTPTSGPPSKRPQVLGGGQPGGGIAATPPFARPDTTPQQASPPINDTELRRRLAAFKANGWQAVDVGGGGDCFFRALAKQVYGDEQLHGPARQETIRYMREHREEISEFVWNFDSYVDRMSREGTYIEGKLEIQAAANAFNVHIKVYGQSRYHDQTFYPLISNHETRPVYMVLYQAAQHYVVLEQMELLSASQRFDIGPDSSNAKHDPDSSPFDNGRAPIHNSELEA